MKKIVFIACILFVASLLNGQTLMYSNTENTVFSGKVGIGPGLTAAAINSTANIYENTSLTDATVGLVIEQDGVGDALSQWYLTSGQRWVAGIDNSDGDKFKISSSADLNTDEVLEFETNGTAKLTQYDATKTAAALGVTDFANLRIATNGDLIVDTLSQEGAKISPELITVTTTTHTAESEFTILADDDTAGAGITITLSSPSSYSDDKIFNIKKIGTTGTITIDTDDAALIDGSASTTLTTQYESVTIQTDGTDWWIL